MTARKSPWRGRILTLFLLGTVGALFLGLLGGVANAGACQGGATKQWTGAVNNSWHEGGNWFPVGVPAAGDDVCTDLTINTPVLFTTGTTNIDSLDAQVPLTISGGTLNLNDAAFDSEATALTLSGGTLGGAGELIVQPAGSMTWSGGTMTNAGTTTIAATAFLSIEGSNAKTIIGARTLDNQGTTIWTDSGGIWHGTGALMTNSGTFDIQTDADMVHNQGGTRLHITNTPAGTFEKTSGVAQFTEIDAALENDGTTEASSGSLVLSGGTDETTPADVSGGDFMATGGFLHFNGGIHRISGAASSVTSDATAGVFFSGGGPSTINPATYAVTGRTWVEGGDFDFNTPAATTELLTHSGGTLGGTGTLTVGDGATWSGGIMADAGTTSIDPTATLSIQSVNAKTINGGRTLDNQGTITWTNTGNIQHGTGALMTNSGTFDIQTTADMAHNQGGTRLHITNTPTGVFEKTAGDGITTIDAALENDGTTQVSVDALQLIGGTDETTPADTSGGDFVAGDQALLDFAGGTHRLSGAGSSVTGLGTVGFSGGNTVVNPETYAVAGTTSVAGGDADFDVPAGTTATLIVNGGTLGGTGVLAVETSAFWGSGIMNDGGTTVIEPLATLAIQGAGTKTINGGHTLDNQGTTNWTGTGTIQHGTGALMTNSGTFDIQTEADMAYNQGGTRLHITNTGIFEKTTVAGITNIDAALENDGITEASSGILQLTGGTDETTPADTSGGDFTATGANLDFASGTHRISGAGSSVTSNAAGTVGFSGGTTVMNPDSYAVAGTTTVVGGDVDFNTAAGTTEDLILGSGTLGGTGDLTVEGDGFWTGGNMSDAGSTVIDPLATLSIQGAGTKTINSGHTLDNQGTTTWTGTGTIQHGTGALMTNSGTFDIQTDADMTHNQGGARLHITNTGTGIFEKTAGTDITTVDAALENDGTVDASLGTLRLTGGTDETTPADTSGGDYMATGATLEFGGGTHRLSGAGSSVTGDGTIGFPGGTTQVGADTDYEVTGTTIVNGGTANFNTLPVSSPTTTNLTLSSGTLGGTGELAVPGIGSWTGGIMADAGTTIFFGTLDISGSAAKTINAHTLDNQGTTTWTGTGDISSGNGAVIDNAGTFIIQNDETLAYNQGGTRLAFNNTGQLARTAPGTGTAELQATVDNSPAGGGEGSIAVASGTLFLNGTGSLANHNPTTDTLSEGKYVVSSATFKFTDADIDVNDAEIILDGATSAIVDAANVDALGDLADNQDSFAIINGRDLTSTVPVSNSGIMTISNGTFTATGDYTQTDGETHLVDAPSELVATGGCVDIQGGVLKGVGTAEPCVDVTGGNVQPGASPGILNADGTYTQSAGTLDIEVGGTTPGTGHDQLAVTGAATLGGTLALDTFGSFTPSDGDSFVVMTFASRTGTFATETWADLPGSLDFTVDYNPTNVTVSVSSTAVPTVSIGDASVTEGDAGTVEAVFQVTLSEPAAEDFTVDYATSDGTASAPSDYLSESGQVTIPAGQDTGTISITVNGDTDDESDETFTVDLSGAPIADGQGVGTITDDDGVASADIQAQKRVKFRGTLTVGKKFQFVVRVKNNGPDQATNITLVDTLPSEVVFVSYRAGQGTCVHNAGTLTCDLGSLAPGTIARVFVVVKAVTAGDTSNTVSASADEDDPVPANNEVIQPFTIEPAP